MRGGTHVSANQGGCTCWCDDCGEAHNCESWSQNKTLKWLQKHGKECVAARRKRIDNAVADLRDAGVSKNLLTPIVRFGVGLALAQSPASGKT